MPLGAFGTRKGWLVYGIAVWKDLVHERGGWCTKCGLGGGLYTKRGAGVQKGMIIFVGRL